MRFIDRFTLDDVSAKVWWPVAMALLVLLVLTFPGEHRAVNARREETAQADAALAQRVIEPSIASTGTTAITGPVADQLKQRVRDEILVNDPRIRAIRLWNTSEEVAWSSVPGESVGVSGTLNDQPIKDAFAAGAPTFITTDTAPDNTPSPTIYYAFSTIGPQPLLAQFDYLDGQLAGDVGATWLRYQIVLGVGLLIVLGLALLSMREPKARIGTNVPFYPGSVPASLAVIEADRVAEIEQAGDRVRDRVGALQQKLDETDVARLRAEGKLQQALATLAIHGYRLPASPEAAPDATAPTVRVPEPTPPRRHVAEPAVPRPEPITAAPTREPEPVAVPEPEPVAVPEPEPVSVPEPEPIAVPEPEPIAGQEPEPVAVPEPEPVAPAASVEQTPEPAAPSAEPKADALPEVVVVPELQPAKTSAKEESASEVLDRLVEPVGSHEMSDEASNLRARLARTAAIKKPGSKERRELDEEQHRT
jgi:outer membrane biosynthesis protein TonB